MTKPVNLLSALSVELLLILKPNTGTLQSSTTVHQSDFTSCFSDSQLRKSKHCRRMYKEIWLRTQLKERQPELLGVSVFSTDQIYTKLKAFKARLQPASEEHL